MRRPARALPQSHEPEHVLLQGAGFSRHPWGKHLDKSARNRAASQYVQSEPRRNGRTSSRPEVHLQGAPPPARSDPRGITSPPSCHRAALGRGVGWQQAPGDPGSEKNSGSPTPRQELSRTPWLPAIRWKRRRVRQTAGRATVRTPPLRKLCPRDVESRLGQWTSWAGARQETACFGKDRIQELMGSPALPSSGRIGCSQ